MSERVIREERSWYANGHVAVPREEALSHLGFYRMPFRRFLIPWRGGWLALPWHRRPETRQRLCSYCKLPIEPGERAVQAKTGNAWAHVTCWYDGGPFERDMREGKRGITTRRVDG